MQWMYTTKYWMLTTHGLQMNFTSTLLLLLDLYFIRTSHFALVFILSLFLFNWLVSFVRSFAHPILCLGITNNQHGWVNWAVLQQRIWKTKIAIDSSEQRHYHWNSIFKSTSQTVQMFHGHAYFWLLLLVLVGRFTFNDIDKMNHLKWWVD